MNCMDETSYSLCRVAAQPRLKEDDFASVRLVMLRYGLELLGWLLMDFPITVPSVRRSLSALFASFLIVCLIFPRSREALSRLLEMLFLLLILLTD